MIEIESLHHVGINVTNLEKAKHFYGTILGLPELKRPPFDFPGAWYAAGTQQIHLLVVPDSETIRKSKTPKSREGHFALRIQSYDQALDWLKKQHVPVLEKPKSTSGFAQLFVCDPDGNIIELHVEREIY